MPSTYSNIKIQLMATGENNTTWGNVTNINLGTALEEAIVGSADVTFASGNVTLTLTDTNASQSARHMRLRCTGVTGGSTRDLIVPAIEKPYIVQNDCLNSIVVKNATGTGITVPAGKTMWVYNDGTNVVDAVNHLSSLTLGTDLTVADGGTGASTFTANGIIYGNTTSPLLATAAGTTGQVLVGNTGGAPSWATLTGIGVTSFSGGTTGLTPASPTTGAITLAGTLGVANGGTGTTTAFTAGSVVFAGASGVYSQDNANLFWDNANDRLGIGTATPSEVLEISSATDPKIRFVDVGNTDAKIGIVGSTALGFEVNGPERMRIDGSGNVGIGTTTPGSYGKFTVVGSGDIANFDTPSGATGIALFENGQGRGRIRTLNGSNGLAFLYGSTEGMRITAAGFVGIGTTAPAVPLDVRGTVSIGTASSSYLGANYNSEILAGVDAGGYYYASGFGAPSNIPITMGDRASYIAFKTSPSTSAGLERMRITGTGDVGIGTGTPSNRLHVNSGASTTSAMIESTGTGAFVGLKNSGATAFIGSDSTGAFLVQTPGSGFSTKMFVGSTGDVGIGTTTPAAPLNIVRDNTAFRGQLSLQTVSAANFAQLTFYDQSTLSGQIYQGYGTDKEINIVNPLAAGVALWTNNTERMRITSAGNVGIGTTTPGATLNVERPSYGVTALFTTADGTGNPRLAIYGSSSGTTIQNTWSSGASNLIFANGGAVGSGIEAMRINNVGNVGINTVTPTQKLDVNGNIAVSGVGNFIAFDTTGAAQANYISTVDNFNIRMYCGRGSTSSFTAASDNASIQTNGSERMRLDAFGNVMIGTTAANNKFLVTYSNPVSVPAAGAGGHCTAFGTVGYGLATGAITNGNAYLQATRWDALAINYDLMLQPNGGNVGIGTVSPAAKLDVDVAGTPGVGLIVKGSSLTSSQVNIGISVVTAGRPFIGTNTNTNPLEIGTRASADLLFLTDTTERMRIDSSGNVGIGATSIAPYFGRTVLTQGSNGATYKAHGTTVQGSFFVSDDLGFAMVEAVTAHPLAFATNGNERMRITSAGNVGIGTTSPNYVLNTNYNANATFTNAGSDFTQMWQNSGTNALGVALADDLTARFVTNNSYAIAFNYAATELMRLTNVGYLGLGTASPANAIEIAQGAGINAAISMRANGVAAAGELFVGQDAANSAYVYNRTGQPLIFGTGNTERARVTAAGELLVGTTTTQTGVAGDAVGITLYGTTSTGAAVFTRDSVNSVLYVNNKTSGGQLVQFYNGGNQVGSITSNGTTTAYVTTSDERLKHDIVNAPEASSLIDAIKVRSFKWNADSSEQRYGFVAQELLTVAPEAVSVPADPDDMMGVDYSKLVPMLVKEIQSLRARVAQLEGK